jgi:hypothetical protein
MPVSATACDSSDRPKAGFGPDASGLAPSPLEESFDRHIGILEPDAIGPWRDRARDAPSLAPPNGKN